MCAYICNDYSPFVPTQGISTGVGDTNHWCSVSTEGEFKYVQ